LLFVDPTDETPTFKLSQERGGTICFGIDATNHFLFRNKLSLLVRSHQVFMPGYDVFHQGLGLSVFSAPNYCGDTGNFATVAKFQSPDSMQPTVVQYEAVHKPMKKRTSLFI
jgi:hypothetical protein